MTVYSGVYIVVLVTLGAFNNSFIISYSTYHAGEGCFLRALIGPFESDFQIVSTSRQRQNGASKVLKSPTIVYIDKND